MHNGLIQFARPLDWNYDPVCFDAGFRAKNREFPIVRIDHEEILCNNRIRVKERLSDSFLALVLEFLDDPG